MQILYHKRQINDNLESQAHTLFKEFSSNENKAKLSTIILDACTGGDAIKKVPIVSVNTGVRCARVGDITNNRQSSMWSFCKATQSTINTYKLHKYDILVTRTATLGVVQLIVDDSECLVFNNGLIRLTVNNNCACELFVYWLLKSRDFQDYIHQIDFATSVRPNMKIEYLLDYEMPLTEHSRQMEFSNLVEPFTLAIFNNHNEINSLRQFQETLLVTLSR